MVQPRPVMNTWVMFHDNLVRRSMALLVTIIGQFWDHDMYVQHKWLCRMASVALSPLTPTLEPW